MPENIRRPLSVVTLNNISTLSPPTTSCPCCNYLGPPGVHTTARELQTRTLEGPGASKTPTKFHEKTPPEREKERTWGREREKKSEILGGAAEGGPRGRSAQPKPPHPTRTGFSDPTQIWRAVTPMHTQPKPHTTPHELDFHPTQIWTTHNTHTHTHIHTPYTHNTHTPTQQHIHHTHTHQHTDTHTHNSDLGCLGWPA